MPLRRLTDRERLALADRPDEAARLIATALIQCDRCDHAAQTTCHAAGETTAVCYPCYPGFARERAAATRFAVRQMLAGAMAMLALTASACSRSGAASAESRLAPDPAGEVTVLVRNTTPRPLAIYSSHLRARVGNVQGLSAVCVRLMNVPAGGATLSARPQASVTAPILSQVIHPSRYSAVAWTITIERTSDLNTLVPGPACADAR